MTDTQKLERLAYLANLPYTKHTSEDWEEELRLECELQDHPQYISFLKSMNTFEVRVTTTHVDYYRINAKDQDQAKALIVSTLTKAILLLTQKKVDTIFASFRN